MSCWRRWRRTFLRAGVAVGPSTGRGAIASCVRHPGTDAVRCGAVLCGACRRRLGRRRRTAGAEVREETARHCGRRAQRLALGTATPPVSAHSHTCPSRPALRASLCRQGSCEIDSQHCCKRLFERTYRALWGTLRARQRGLAGQGPVPGPGQPAAADAAAAWCVCATTRPMRLEPLLASRSLPGHLRAADATAPRAAPPHARRLAATSWRLALLRASLCAPALLPRGRRRPGGGAAGVRARARRRVPRP